jgi:hypothetical protein
VGFYEKLSDSLNDEVMTDMAESFFGSRRAMEDDLELFQAMLRRLDERKVELQRVFAVLRRLLLDEGELEALLRRLGADPEQAPEAVEPLDPRPCGKPPSALGFSRRYARVLQWAYACFRDALDVYRHGRWEDDPEQPGRKTLSVSREQVRDRCEELNERIRTMNTTCSPVCMLQYIKEMDPGRMERERITGADFAGYACSLDDKLAFQPLDFDSLGFPAYCDVPEPKQARDALRDTAVRLARERGDEARQALGGVLAARGAVPEPASGGDS